MITLKKIVEYLETQLNNELTVDEREYSPFKLYTDIGEARKSYRKKNRVKGYRYGVVSVITSSSAPLNYGALQIYSYSVAVDILVNVDHIAYDEDLGDVGEYPEVAGVRKIIDTMASERSGIPYSFTSDDNKKYTATSVYTLGGAGAYSVQTSELGKVVPITFTADVTIVQSGVNSADVVISIDGESIPCSQFGIDLVSSTEGQTRSGGGNSKFNVQETTFSLSFITPLVDSEFCKKMITKLHNPSEPTTLEVGFAYSGTNFGEIPDKIMYPTAVRLTGAVPDNVGMNIELLEADTDAI